MFEKQLTKPVLRRAPTQIGNLRFPFSLEFIKKMAEEESKVARKGTIVSQPVKVQGPFNKQRAQSAQI